MYTLDEIRAINAARPEPPIVGRVREHLKRSFGTLRFEPVAHKYFIPAAAGSETELPSMSAVVERFVPQVDWNEKAAGVAARNGSTTEAVLRMWNENKLRAANNGTSTHLYGEAWMHFALGRPEDIDPVIRPQMEEGYLIPYSPKQEAVMKFWEDVLRDPTLYPVAAECRIHSLYVKGLENHYAGTFDALFLRIREDGRPVLLLKDYKTNAEIRKEYARSHGQTLYPPFQDIVDDPEGHYTLQQNGYSMALASVGLRVESRDLIWLKDDGSYEEIRLPDIEERMRVALSGAHTKSETARLLESFDAAGISLSR